MGTYHEQGECQGAVSTEEVVGVLTLEARQADSNFYFQKPRTSLTDLFLSKIYNFRGILAHSQMSIN